MNKIVKVCLLLAAVLIPVGVVLVVIGNIFGGGSGVGIISNGKFSLSSGKTFDFESNDYKDIDRILVDVSNAKINIEQTTEDSFGIEVHLYGIQNDPVITCENKQLQLVESGKNFIFNFNFFDLFSHDGENKVTIKVPQNVKLSQADLSTNNGAVELMDISTDNLKVKSSNGKIQLSKMNVTKDTVVETSNGKIICDGTFSGSTLFKSSNGAIEVNGNLSGDVTCKTSNGRIEYIEKSKHISDINLTADTSNGSIYINEAKVEHNYSQNVGAQNSLNLKSSNGAITVTIPK